MLKVIKIRSVLMIIFQIAMPKIVHMNKKAKFNRQISFIMK